jgi:hypothetical protein
LIPGSSVWTRLAAGAGIFFLLEGAVFRTDLYTTILEPDSSAAQLLLRLHHEKSRTFTTPNQVLSIGDSRMSLRPGHANQLEAETGYHHSTIAMPGSTPRCWYYMLRDVDPAASRYRAIVIGTDDYDDEDYEDMSGRELDIRLLTPLMPLTEVFQFAASYPRWTSRWEAFRAGVLKGFAYRADFQDFLTFHSRRFDRVDAARRTFIDRVYNGAWSSESLAGLGVDWQRRVIAFPEKSSEEQRSLIRGVLFRETIPQTGQRGAYLRLWYGRIVEHYRGSATRLILLRLPRGPVVRPRAFEPKTAAAREFGARAEITLTPEHTYDCLERPELFGDPLHLNEPGAREFSRMLARDVRRILGPPR